MAAELEEGLDHSHVPLIDRDVQGCLASLISGIEICSALGQQLHDGRLITEGGVMDGSVSIFILQTRK